MDIDGLFVEVTIVLAAEVAHVLILFHLLLLLILPLSLNLCHIIVLIMHCELLLLL